MTGTVERTCTPTPASSHSRRRTAGSQTLLVTSRNCVPSSRTRRALHSPGCWSRTKPPYPNRSLQRGSSAGNKCVWTSTLLMRVAALLAGRVLRVAPVPREDGRQLLHDVGQVERLAVQLVAAAVADPEEGVQLVREAAPLEDQPDRVRRALRRGRGAPKEPGDLPLAGGDVSGVALFG